MASHQDLAPAPTTPNPGSFWRHFKGTKYTVLEIARDCDDPSRFLVIYKDDSDNVWARPHSEFLGCNEFGNPRFVRLG
jgi:hypothetical protein